MALSAALKYLYAGKYELYKKLNSEDFIQSTVIQGFRIPVAAIFDAKSNTEAISNLVQQ